MKLLLSADIKTLNLDYIYAADWKHPFNQIEEWCHRSAKCAEVLVPEKVPPTYLRGTYVVDKHTRKNLKTQFLVFPLQSVYLTKLGIPTKTGKVATVIFAVKSSKQIDHILEWKNRSWKTIASHI